MLFVDRLSEMASVLEKNSEGQELVFSGMGYSAMTDYFGSIVTVHRENRFIRGRLVGIEVRDKYDFEFYDSVRTPDEEIDDDDDSDLILDDGLQAVINDWESELEEPPDNYRLYGRFLVKHSEGIEYPIAGSAVVADSINTLQYIDLSTIELHHVDEESDTEFFDVEIVPDALRQFSARYRLGLKDKSFRNANAKKQQRYLEPMIDTMNSALGMERFTVLLPDGKVYTPNILDGELYYEQYELEYDLIAGCLKVDCLELQVIKDGKAMKKRRGNIDANDSLCVIAEIDQDQADFHGIDSNIVWIPILSQMDFMEFPFNPPI